MLLKTWYSEKIYVIETAFQPQEKRREFANLEVSTRPSTRLEYNFLRKNINRTNEIKRVYVK